MLRVHVRQNALSPHMCILQWSTPFQSCGANHLQLSARCYWRTPADSALENGLSNQQVLVVGCCCCCCCCSPDSDSGLVSTSKHLLLDQLNELRRESKSIVASRRHLLGLEKMRKHNRMRSRGKTLPICTWDKHNNITPINSNKGIQRSNYRYKSARTILYTWGNTTTVMVVD